MPPRYAVVLGLAVDLRQPGKFLGDESILHCLKVGEVTRKLFKEGFEVRVVFAADRSPDKLSYPIQPLSMAELMKKMTHQQLPYSPEVNILVPHPLRWGTRGEIAAAEKEKTSWENLVGWHVELHIVASWYHAPRVKFLLWNLGIRNSHLHLTEGSFPHALIELIKFPAEIVRGIANDYEANNAKS